MRKLAERFDLDLSRRFREYSSGNKQKLGIVLAFMHTPELLILDEPTGGLDPLNQQEFYALLREVRDDGATVFLSSHILSEVEHVCDRVGIVRAGRLVQVADLGRAASHPCPPVEIEFAPAAPIPEAAMRDAEGVRTSSSTTASSPAPCMGASSRCSKRCDGAHVTNLVSHEPSLEEIFLELLQRAP